MIKHILAAALLAASTAPAAAVTYDAFTSFNATQGAGNFYYGSADEVAAVGTLFTATTNCFITGSTCLQAAANHDVPGATKSSTPSFQYGSVNVPTDRLLLHPGNTTADGSVFIAFVAPTAGRYRYTATFNVQDVSPSGVNIGFSQTVGTAPVAFFGLGALSAANPTYTFSGQTVLGAGDSLNTFINRAGFYGNDSTGENFSVSSFVPEPATWAMMVGGFGLVALATRRRASRLAA